MHSHTELNVIELVVGHTMIGMVFQLVFPPQAYTQCHFCSMDISQRKSELPHQK